jgi:hypothetical protein
MDFTDAMHPMIVSCCYSETSLLLALLEVAAVVAVVAVATATVQSASIS